MTKIYGPWQVLPEEPEKPYIRVRGVVPGSRFKIANVPVPEYRSPREDIETLAIAELIAAAPELLEALKDLLIVKVRIHDLTENDVHSITKAKAIIAKLEGKLTE